MTDINRVKIQNFIETQIPEFLNSDSPLFKEFLEQYYISLEHQTGTIDLANNFIEYKEIDNFNKETFFTEQIPCILVQDIRSFDSVITVNHTIGFPSKYGLLKIDNEIITYTSKTNNTFEGCIRGFSGIDKINNKNFYGDFEFLTTNAEDHSRTIIVNGEERPNSVENLNVKFFGEIFTKFKYQFLPGFENRKFFDGIELQNILTRAKDFYTTKGTDTSYKLLFKVLFGKEIEIIKPQDYMLRPSDNKYFITKNILVERVLGDIDPLILKGETFFQKTSDGLATASGSIFNIEVRPVDDKILYEISLDPDSILLKFKTTNKTKVIESTSVNSDSIIVDSTIGFPNSGQLLVQSVNAPNPFIINYTEKTTNQFLGVTGNIVDYSVNDSIIENNFAYCEIDGETVYFRIINVINSVDYSNTSGLRVGDKINLSSFGLELNDRSEFSKWIYNIPSNHLISSLNQTSEPTTWRVELFDSVTFNIGEILKLTNPDYVDDISQQVSVRRIVSDKIIEVTSGGSLSNKTVLSKIITKSNVLNYPEVNDLVSNIQNTYIDKTKENFYITSSGLPDYRVVADDRKILISTPPNPNPTLGIGVTTTINTNKKHKFYTGEKIYLTPSGNLGIVTGSYFVYSVGNYVDSQQISLAYSYNDLFSRKFINVSYGATGEFVKLDYENKIIEHQKILRKFNLNKSDYNIDDIRDRTTNNRPIGVLLNGVEIYSPTVYDENIYYGKLDNIKVIAAGKDYDVINTPKLVIEDSIGFGATAHLNVKGSVKSIKILNPGNGYTNNVKVSIVGGNGTGALLKPNVIKTRAEAGFRGDGTGVNPTNNSINFIFPHNFEDGEEIEYISNGNREIEYSGPIITVINGVETVIGSEIRKLPSNSFYFAGVISDTIIKLYRTPEDAANKVNEINLTTSPSSGFHYFRTLQSRNVLVDVSIENSGENYSNKKVVVPGQTDNLSRQNGIDIVNDTIFAKNHNFNDKDLVVYSTTGTTITGLSTESKYYVKFVDEDRFKLSYAGLGNNISEDNFIKNKVVRLKSTGSGTHTFSYPPIELIVEADPEVANGELQLPILEPIVLGSIDSVFLENHGEKYGTPDIINFHRKPLLNVGTITTQALFKPIIIDGKIIDVQVLNYGRGYGNDVDLIIRGKGKFAELYPVIEDGRIKSVIILNSGIGYDNTTTIDVIERGSGVKFDVNVFQWKLNQVKKNEFLLQNEDEGILVPSKNQQTGLQFIHFYPPKVFRKKLSDNIDSSNREQTSNIVSPIIGWAYDGFPIYGPYYNINNTITRVRSSYRTSIELNSNLRPSGVDFPDGFFIQDYSFDRELGDLDEYNGKFVITDEFPQGTYAYFYTIDIDTDRNSIPVYPYIASTEFKNHPELENYNPRYNQDHPTAFNSLVRNISPYYLNSTTSYYDALDKVQDKFKQEFIIKSLSNSGIDSISIYDSGDNYKVGDILDFNNENTGGTGIYASISEIQGKPIDAFNVGITTLNSVVFEKTGNTITGISKVPINIQNQETVSITNISSNKFKFIEGTKKITVFEKIVGITTNILNIGATGNITTIYVNDIVNFEVDDFIKIDQEILKIIEIIPSKSAFRVQRLSNPGIHTSGVSLVKLLPRKFTFKENGYNLVSVSNKTVYFNAEEVVGFGNTYLLGNNDVITIPERSIYIPNHSFFTGQPLTYNSGVDGTNLFVSNSLGGSNFQLSTGQTVYAVNYGKDFLGISTLGFTTSVGIGSTLASLYFDSSVSGVGVAHSFTTQFTEIFGKVENYSITITTSEKHGLLGNDIVSLNLIPEISQTIKFRYDPIIRKITTELIDIDSSLVSITTNEIVANTESLKTGDKVVYYSNGNSAIGGLQNNEVYFVVLSNPGKIKLSNYYTDALDGITIDLTSISSGIHSIAKINPKLDVTKGNYVEFDLSDSSLTGLTLRLYKDFTFKNELEEFKYISNTRRFLRTSLNNYPREIYYSFFSTTSPVFPDYEVLNNNLIELIGSDYNSNYNISVLSDNSFKINLDGKPESLDYNDDNVSDIKYTTNSKNTSGPIEKIKLNFGGRGYFKVPKLSRVISQSGRNAIVKAKSNKIGRITSLDRIKDGFDYPTDVTLSPLLSVPAVVQVEDISRVDYVGIITGGRNYNTAPTLKVIGNDKIKLQSYVQGNSVVRVDVIENTNDISTPLRIVPLRNSNGYSIDDISVNGNNVTLELLNSDNQIYPLITTGYGTTEVKFPFELGDEIFIERCRLSTELGEGGVPIQKDNYNSSNYGYRFFTVTGISSENYTITYSMQGLSDNLGEYTSDFGYGYVVNRKDMAEFEMIIANDLKYVSGENVFGYNERGTNTFSAKVMENGWDNDINELRLIDVKGELKVGDKLAGKISLLNGKVTDVNIFNLISNIDVTRDKLNDLGDRVGFLNDFQQRISDNNYYQKFSYSIKGEVPYNIWREPVKSVIHPSGFKEFSDLVVGSAATATMRVGTASSLELLVNIDNTQSLYTKNNFAMVTEEEQFEDGSVERVIFEDGVTLKPYILSKTNKVINIDDISSQFTGTSKLGIVTTKSVTFISTDLYRLGVNTEGLIEGDKIGFSTYHFYPDSTYILTIGNNYVGISSDTPHRLYSRNGITTSVTQNLEFYRRIPGDKIIGISSFKLTSDNIPLIYKEFDASNSITTSIVLESDSFILPNHNFQTGQNIKYTPQYDSITAIANTTVGSGAILEPVFVGAGYSVSRINVINGGSGYSSVSKPVILITGTKTPLIQAAFNPQIQSGIITSIQIVNPGYGYFPNSPGEIGISTTTESEGRKDIIMGVGGGIGSAIYEQGYNVAISTTVSGISSNVVPNFSGQQNRFWGFTEPYIPVKQTSGSGIDAKFSVFIVYNSTTGQPISTSVVLRDGGRGYSVGDTISIAGTYMGGATPQNDLSFKVSKVSSTRIASGANGIYNNIPGTTTVGFGSGAIFNVRRNSLGDISNVSIVFGGSNYELTDNISIAGTYIGGTTPLDNLLISPTILGTDKLPENLYVQKINNNIFKVAGLSTGGILNLASLGIGTHSFEVLNPNSSSVITIDNIIQTPVYKKSLKLSLSRDVSYNDSIIYVQSGISSVVINDILQINDEYLSVNNINVDGPNSIQVTRGFLGTNKVPHNITDTIFFVGGNYNIIKDVIYFSTPPYGPTGFPGFEVNSSFSGRLFSRRFDPFIPEDKNIIFDDISNQFTGIAATEFVLKSDGENVVGIFTNTNSITGSSVGVDINNNPLILINNIPQIGGKDYVIDTPGRNTIKFISGVPLAGKITKVGYTTGFGYLPLVGASATVSVSAAGTISNVYLTGFGKGYRTPPIISIASTVGSGASITSTIGTAGTITSLTIVNPGSGYTNTILPEVRIDLPQNYYNLDLEYKSGSSGQGQGAKVSVTVGNGSSIVAFNLDSPGTSYKVGDVLVISGISTDPKASNFKPFEVTVLETFTDKFAGWYPGQFIQFDDISSFFNGRKKKFTLTVTQFGVKEVISLKANPEDVNLTNNLFIFVNDILQVPGEAYTFSGSRINFTEAPKSGSKCNILFFRGSDLDVEQVDPPKTIKQGDVIQIDENISDPFDRPQFDRVVKDIVTTDILDTFPYDSLGISTDPNDIRPLNWTKQTQDKIINGVLYSKSRPNLKSKITPTAKIIKDIKLTDREIYVDSAIPLFEDIDENRNLPEDLRDVIIVNNREITDPEISVVVSTGSTISNIIIDNPGSGYRNNTQPIISISSRFITKKDPIFNWSPNVGIASTSNLNSIGYGTGFVAVGSSGYNLVSFDGISWNKSRIIDASYNFTDVIGYGNSYISVGQTGSVYRKVGLDTNSTWSKINLKRFTVDVLGGVTIVNSNYNNQFNKVSFNPSNNRLVVVGKSGGLFSSVGINTTELYDRILSFSDLNSVTNNLVYFVAVGNAGDILYSIDGSTWNIVLTKITLQNLNDVIWDGSKFIAVGNNGTIITSLTGEVWNINLVNNFNKNIMKINYYDGVYTIIDSSGYLYFSLNLTDWIYREVSQNYLLSDIISTGSVDSIKYVSVGTSSFISYSTPVINAASASVNISNEQVSSVDIINGGFGYPTDIEIPAIIETDVCEKEQIYSIKAKGDFGIIKNLVVYETGSAGFGTTSPAIEFVLESKNFNTPIIPTMQYSPLSVGDYFVISDSNVECGYALTGITTSIGGMSNYPASKVGTAITFIDGIYRVEGISTSSLGTTTVRCHFAPMPSVGPDRIQINIGVNTTGFYGRYSFGMIYDYQNRARENPKQFIINKDEGLVGLNTGPLMYRTRSLV
jgi:hypothetical protein